MIFLRKKGSKYKAKKSIDPITGVKYDSKKEHRRASQLKLLERGGKVSNLKEQVRFELLPTFKDNQNKTERSIVYVADFTYNKDGKEIVEDLKSSMTAKLPTYVMKRKLFKARYPQYIFYENTD